MYSNYSDSCIKLLRMHSGILPGADVHEHHNRCRIVKLHEDVDSMKMKTIEKSEIILQKRNLNKYT